MQDRFVVASAVQIDVRHVHLTVQEVHVLWLDIHSIQEVVIQPASMTLRALQRKSIVLVEPKNDCMRKVHLVFAIQRISSRYVPTGVEPVGNPNTVRCPNSARSLINRAIIWAAYRANAAELSKQNEGSFVPVIGRPLVEPTLCDDRKVGWDKGRLPKRLLC